MCDPIPAIRQLIPPIRIPHRIRGLPLGEGSSVVAEEEDVTETGDFGLAGEEGAWCLVLGAWCGDVFAEGGKCGGGVLCASGRGETTPSWVSCVH